MMKTQLTLPLSIDTKQKLAAGQKVLLSGTVYTARDAAHKRLVEALAKGDHLPFDPDGASIFYVGPTPPKDNGLPGAAGPTTSSRMDPYTAPLLEAGVSAIIGKGARSAEVNEALLKHRAIYFAAVGGAAALLAQSIKSMAVIAYPELGPEAVYKMEIENMPVYVGYDLLGRNIYGLHK
ncbi:FumA C-terminus/TtdB family hydratase beta subunit [Candidatus Margulisiibacteriota bacterium]